MKKQITLILLLSVSLVCFALSDITINGIVFTDADNDGYYDVASKQHLIAMSIDPDKLENAKFEQTVDIIFNEDPSLEDWDNDGDPDGINPQGFTPITLEIHNSEGDEWNNYDYDNTTKLIEYNGRNFIIKNLYINRPSSSSVGLFKRLYNYEDHIYDAPSDENRLINIHLVNCDITGLSTVGALAGDIKRIYINGCTVSGQIRGQNSVGGIVGSSKTSNISYCTVMGLVSGQFYVGGILGQSVEDGSVNFKYNSSLLNNCNIKSAVVGANYVGSLIGYANYSNASNCLSSGYTYCQVLKEGKIAMFDYLETYINMESLYCDKQTSQIKTYPDYQTNEIPLLTKNIKGNKLSLPYGLSSESPWIKTDIGRPYIFNNKISVDNSVIDIKGNIKGQVNINDIYNNTITACGAMYKADHPDSTWHDVEFPNSLSINGRIPNLKSENTYFVCAYAIDQKNIKYLGDMITWKEKKVIYHPIPGKDSSTTIAVPAGSFYTFDFESFINSGYTISEWNTEMQGTNGTSFYAGDSILIDDDEYHVYARWELKQYHVNYNGNGGSGSMPQQTFLYNDNVSLLTNTFTKDGYKLTAWNTESDGSGTGFNAQHTFLMPDSSLMLYAQWEIDGHYINFYPNGGSGNMTPLLVSTGKDTAITINAFSKSEYNFIGWNTDSQGKGIYYPDTSTITMSNSDINLYAQWEISGYYISYYPNGGLGNMTPIFVEKGNDTTLNINSFIFKGYQFSGWNTLADGSGIFYNDASQISMSQSNIALYAQWQPLSYSINYLSNNGSGFMPSTETSYSSEVTLDSALFTRIGYTFAAWNTDVDGLGKRYLNKESLTKGLGDLNLYAQWSPIAYSITYKNTEGAINPNPSSYNIESPKIELAHSVRKNKAFDGWYTDSLFLQEAKQIPQGNTGNKTYYAKWSNEFSIAYYSNGGLGQTLSENITISGNNYTIKNNPFSRRGYQFKEWNTLPDASGNTYYESQITTLNDSIDFVLFAIWKPITYNINYRNNINTNNPNPLTYNTLTPSFVFADLSTTGFTFNGWYNDSLMLNKVRFLPQGSIGDTTLYANWDRNQYSISYCKNYGDGKVIKQTYYYDTDTTLSASPFERKGYMLSSWNTLANGNGSTYNDKESIHISDQNIVIYAQWELENYTITYQHLNGVANTNPTQYNVNTPDFTLEDLSLKGYTFQGWYSDSTYNSRRVSVSQGDTGKLILYAKWRINEYQISYQNNGGIGAMTAQKMTYNSSGTLSPNTFSRMGYIFSHWNTKADNTGTNYTNAQALTMDDANLSLYAQWQIINYTIAYKNTMGVSINSPLDYNAEDEFTLNALHQKGYSFIAWYEDENFTLQKSTVAIGDTGNLTLYAKWEINTYQINYNKNGATGTMPQQNIIYNSDTSLRPLNYTRSGYQFSHWNTEADNSGTDYTDQQKIKMSDSDLNLYAQWDIINYTINYNTLLESINNNPRSYNTTQNIALSPLTKEGYDFIGWFTNSDYDTPISRISVGDTGELTLFAQWKIKSFDISISNGGRGNIKYHNATSDTIHISVLYGDSLSQIEAIPEDKTDDVFIGWSDGVLNNPRSIDNITSAIDLSALWATPVNIIFSDTVKSYNGKVQTATIHSNHKVNYTIKYKRLNDTNYSALFPLYAGEYKMDVSIKEEGYIGSNECCFTILPQELNVEVNKNQGKNFGEQDPDSLSYTLKGLIDGDIISGSLTRAPGESPGYYPISLGSLAVVENSNTTDVFNKNTSCYTINVVDADFFIDSEIEIYCKWEYMLIVDNNDDEFASYQWYKDGQPIVGANKQYYYNDSHTLCGSFQCEISFIGTSAKLLTEPVEYNYCNTLEAKSLSLFPNPVCCNSKVNIKRPNDEKIISIKLYTPNGLQQQTQYLSLDKDIEFNAPAQIGIYKLIIIYEDGTNYTQSLLVK